MFTSFLFKGWESKRDGQNKLFFIDHTTRTTTYIDPRLPLDIPEVNPHQVSIVPIRRRGRGPNSASTNGVPTPNVIIPSSSSAVNHVFINQLESTSATASTSVSSNPLPIPPPRPLVSSPVPGAAGPSAMSSSLASTSQAVMSTSDQPSAYFDSTVPTAYNDKVVAFLQQPNIIDILSERKSSIKSNSSLRDRIFSIRSDGVEALHRFSNDIELIMLLSLFENEIMSYVPPSVTTPFNVANISSQRSQSTSSSSFSFSVLSVSVPTTRIAGAAHRRDFDAKLRNFYRKIEKNGYGQGPGKLKLIVRRDNILADAFNKIMSISTKKELQKSRLYISFLGEEGLDYGGPSREFFFILSR